MPEVILPACDGATRFLLTFGDGFCGLPQDRGLVERPLWFFRLHWDHEPLAVQRQTESADKSDGFDESHRAALQTLRALRRRPAVAKRLECVRLQRRFPKPGYDSMTGQVHGKPLLFFRMHWDPEPTPDPSQEGNCEDADECLLPSWEGSGVGRFME